jgi:hypothetical protein
MTNRWPTFAQPQAELMWGRLTLAVLAFQCLSADAFTPAQVSPLVRSPWFGVAKQFLLEHVSQIVL